MRIVYASLIAAALVAGCSKPAAPPASGAAPAAPGTSTTAAPAAPTTPAAAPAASGPAVSGTYLGSGKDARLAYVTAHKGEPFDGQPITVLVFSAKDQAGSEKPDWDAIFGKFGNAMVIKVEPDGKIIGADLVHEGLEGADRSVSVGGFIDAKDYKAAGGQISGTITTNGAHDVFGHQLDINVTFHVPAP